MENAKISPKKGGISTQTIVGIGILTAVVIVLQFVSMGLRFATFSITLTLIPIVVGAALYGWKAGAWLGFVFGVAVLLTGDAAAFLTINVPGTITVVLLKGALAGTAAGLIYRAIEKKNAVAAAFVSAVATPIVNTGIFLLGCRVFFYDTICQWGEGAGFANVGAYMIFGLVGINFLIELGTNLILSSTIVTIVNLGRKTLTKGNGKSAL